MCGIAGVLYADQARPVDPAFLRAMGHTIRHRGPDADGYWSEPGIGLVHRRLSIIDLAGGDQPIANEEGSLQVVFNGEIYNFLELREDLESKGHHFKTRSDTEVLVHLYEEEGERLVERLRGMFAFALWDRRRRNLLLARDRLGIKPLYLYRDAHMVVFGSELKAILSHPGVDQSLNLAALEAYLAFGVVPGPASIFRGIEKLPPASLLNISLADWESRSRTYWQLQFAPDLRPSEAEWIEAIQAKVKEAVRLHMIADVPVGAFLSGGIDSSVIVAEAAELCSGPLQTFSIGFREEQFSELPHAREVARAFGTKHTEEIVTPDAVTLLDELTKFYDEPFADPSALPTFLVSRLASRSVKVVLSGDGGDEAFGGYARYAHDLKESRIRRLLPQWFRRRVLKPLAAIWPKADWLPRPLRARTLLTNLALDPAAAYANTLTISRAPQRRQLLSAGVVDRLNGWAPETQFRSVRGFDSDALAGMLGADVQMLLPDDFLVKVDRASMAHGLEVRPPLLDHELMELAARIPSGLKINKGQTKYLFRAAYRERLPARLLNRPKQGFEMPIDSWLRGPLREVFQDAVLDRNSVIAATVNQSEVDRLYQTHLRGTGRHGAVLWSLLVLARWAERYLQAPATVPVS